MPASEDTLILFVGPPGTPLRPLKGKEMRGRIISFLRDSTEGAELQLRGYLSIGKMPPPNLLTVEVIAAALNVQDRVRYLSRLSGVVRFLDAQAVLAAINEFVLRIGDGEVYRLAKGLARSARNWTNAKTPFPTDGTIVSFLEAVSFLIRKIDSRQPRRKTKKGSSSEDFLPLIRVGIGWAAVSQDGYTSLLAIEMFSLANARLGVDVDGLLDQDQVFTHNLGVIHARALQRLKTMAEAGDVIGFEKWARVILESRFNASEIKSAFQAMVQEKVRFSEPIQMTLKKILGVSETQSKGPEVSVEAPQSIQTGQLSSALLHAWSARSEGMKAKEAFEELESVLARFLGIRLGGEVGAVESYNPRLHEFVHGEAPSPVVQVIRPWVEVSQGDKASITIKALVRAKPQEG